MARERATHVLLGHGHFGAVAHPGFAAAAAALTQVVLSGAKVPPALFDDLERRGLWSGQLFGMGEGLLPHHPSRRAPRRPRHHGRHPALAARRDPRARARHRGGGARRRGRRAVLPRARTRCAATSTRRSTTRARSPPTASTAPATSPRSARSTASGTSRSRAASRTSSTAAARRSTPRRWSCCCSATRASPPPPSSPCPIRGWASAPARTSSSTASRSRWPRSRRTSPRCGVAKFKWPERIEHLSEIPRTLVGKIDKKRLAADVAAKLGALPSRA